MAVIESKCENGEKKLVLSLLHTAREMEGNSWPLPHGSGEAVSSMPAAVMVLSDTKHSRIQFVLL